MRAAPPGLFAAGLFVAGLFVADPYLSFRRRWLGDLLHPMSQYSSFSTIPLIYV